MIFHLLDRAVCEETFSPHWCGGGQIDKLLWSSTDAAALSAAWAHPWEPNWLIEMYPGCRHLFDSSRGHY